MKNATKILLITTALITASGVAVAGRGYGGYNCDGPGFQGRGPGMMQQMRGQYGPGRGMQRGPGAIYQLDNLTDDQKEQISQLQRAHRQSMFNQREQMWAQRAEMKKQIDAILTDEQREQLSQLRPWR